MDHAAVSRVITTMARALVPAESTVVVVTEDQRMKNSTTHVGETSAFVLGFRFLKM